MIKVGIIGSGAMGTGIAQVAGTAGHEVLLCDNNPDALNRAKKHLEKIMARLTEKNKISEEEATTILQRISFVDTVYAYKDVGIVIEAIVENLVEESS